MGILCALRYFTLPLLLSWGEGCHLPPEAGTKSAIKLALYGRLYKDLHGKRAGNEKQMEETIVPGKQAGEPWEGLGGS